MEYSKDTKGYGKKSVWYWIGLYVIIAVIVYGAIFMIYKKTQSTNGSGMTNSTSIY